MCFGCAKGSNDLYEITTNPAFKEGVENSIIEYRYLIGKNMNNFNLAALFRQKRVKYYNGKKESRSYGDWQQFDILVDLRHDFIYGVYRA